MSNIDHDEPVEPFIHGIAIDGLPEGHLMEHEEVVCTACGAALHASNNEAMQPWVEVPNGQFICGPFNLCVPCFSEWQSDEWSDRIFKMIHGDAP